LGPDTLFVAEPGVDLGTSAAEEPDCVKRSLSSVSSDDATGGGYCSLPGTKALRLSRVLSLLCYEHVTSE